MKYIISLLFILIVCLDVSASNIPLNLFNTNHLYKVNELNSLISSVIKNYYEICKNKQPNELICIDLTGIPNNIRASIDYNVNTIKILRNGNDTRLMFRTQLHLSTISRKLRKQLNKDQLFRHNDDSYSLTKIVKSTRPSIYDTDNKSNLFTIDKITKVRGDLYLIEATRNDSLFLIFSQDGLQHILDSKIIKKGGVYSIKLKKLYPDEYPQNNDNKHISIDLQRYFYGLKDNHHMAYKALDLNGLHLEIAE